MIIQCAQCKARFRLDDSKVSDAGIKVRCSKCKHIFVVKKEAPVEESDLDVLLQGLGSPSAGTELAAGAGTVAAVTAMPADQALEAATPPPAEEPFSFSGAPEEFSSSVVAESSEDREGYSLGIEPAEPEKPVADFQENTRPEEAFGGFEFEKDDSAAAAISGEAGFLASDSAMSEGGEELAGSGTIEEEEISFGEVSPRLLPQRPVRLLLASKDRKKRRSLSSLKRLTRLFTEKMPKRKSQRPVMLTLAK